jgi:hypothetical protein
MNFGREFFLLLFLAERKSKATIIFSLPKTFPPTGHMSSPRQPKNNKPGAGFFRDDALCTRSKSPYKHSPDRSNCNPLNFARVYIASFLEFNI